MDAGGGETGSNAESEAPSPPVIEPVHDPVVLALLGLPPGIWGWRIEMNSNDLSTFTPGDWSGLSASVVFIDKWDPDPDDISIDPAPKFARAFPGGGTYDVVHVEASLANSAASLVWSRATREGPARLDIHHVEDLTQAQLIQLWQARTLVALDFTRVLPGPKRGEATAIPLDEFPGKYEAARAAVRAGPDPVTLWNVALELGVSARTLQNLLRDSHMKWKREPSPRGRR